MEKFYEKIKTFSENEPKKLLIIQIIVGVISGMLCWLALRLGSNGSGSNDFLRWIWIILFAVLMLGSGKIAKETGVSNSKFRLAVAGGIAICLIIFAITHFVFKIEGGLLGYLLPELFLHL